MRLHIKPQRGLPGNNTPQMSVNGDVLTFDGEAFDLSAVSEGGQATPSGDHPFQGVITRQGGVLSCTVIMPLGDDLPQPQPINEAGWVLEVTSGPVTLPVEGLA